jgi:hypothetical protein
MRIIKRRCVRESEREKDDVKLYRSIYSDVRI